MTCMKSTVILRTTNGRKLLSPRASPDPHGPGTATLVLTVPRNHIGTDWYCMVCTGHLVLYLVYYYVPTRVLEDRGYHNSGRGI